MTDGFLSDLGLDKVEADPNYIADGTYEAYVFNAEVRTKKDGTTRSLVLTFKITPNNPKHSGQTQQEWFELAPTGENAEIKKSFLKARILSLGVPEAKIASINPPDLVGIKVMMRIKHSGQYQNVGQITLADGTEGVAATTSVPTEVATSLM